MHSFGNFQQEEVVYVGQEMTIFPEYLVLIPTFTKEGTLGRKELWAIYIISIFSEVPGINMFDPIYINYST
jgi:hypothetical protein